MGATHQFVFVYKSFPHRTLSNRHRWGYWSQYEDICGAVSHSWLTNAAKTGGMIEEETRGMVEGRGIKYRQILHYSISCVAPGAGQSNARDTYSSGRWNPLHVLSRFLLHSHSFYHSHSHTHTQTHFMPSV